MPDSNIRPPEPSPGSSSTYTPDESIDELVDVLAGLAVQYSWAETIAEVTKRCKLPDIRTKHGLKKVHKDWDKITLLLNKTYATGRARGESPSCAVVIAIYVKMCADSILCKRIFAECDFLEKVRWLLTHPNGTSGLVVSHCLYRVSLLCDSDDRKSIGAKLGGPLMDFIEKRIDNDPDGSLQFATTALANSLSVYTQNITVSALDAADLRAIDTGRLIRLMLKLVRRPSLFDVCTFFLSSATLHCRAEFEAIPEAIPFLAACTFSSNSRFRNAGLMGILKYQWPIAELETPSFSDSREEILKAADFAALTGPGGPLENAPLERSEAFPMVYYAPYYMRGMDQVAQDHDYYTLGTKLAGWILACETVVIMGEFNKSTVVQPFPCRNYIDVLPLCAKALRDRGGPEDRFKADVIEIKYNIAAKRYTKARELGKKCTSVYPQCAFFWYAASCEADQEEALRYLKKGMKCSGQTEYVKFNMLYRASTSAMTLAQKALRFAMYSQRTWQEAVAFSMSALDDTRTFLDTASPDAKRMGDVAYIYVLMVMLVKGHELKDDSEEVMFVKSKIRKAESVAHYFSRPIPRTENRLAALMLLDLRSSPSCSQWRDVIIAGTAHAKQDTTMSTPKTDGDSSARDDLNAWLAKGADDPEAEGQYIVHSDNRVQPVDGANMPSWAQSELYRCSWCRNPSAVLHKCRNCGKVRYCDSVCQKQHWKAHKPACKA
ncbi:uncharacterized protein STEHIDRAFT_125885 [Stereum hirsutum FP-91666 SS1]|uniref:MYND-type domain-containing protein n=1 Tax=Stereum hirsutum (strain FP-91666) TaxID=721885 RepID=R7S171_STEHR|nr:uncharacterized protein STEHIDRAFT_125885 [Stereum hirsutum FP-91666 SS1]EIM80312.1 hypothetical protein STEHIDRAFT_125885 [Stereum hirsutum FP-91666 SS1]